MKKTIGIAGLIGVLLSLSGCSSYYYAMLDSNDRSNQRNSTRDFVQENDTVSIIYCFYGENAPVQITVHNKLNEPLYVDWERSGIIIDDVATGYGPGNARIEGDMVVDAPGRAAFTGEMGLPQGVSFVPPASRVVKTPLMLANFPFDNIPNKEYKKMPFAMADSKMETVRTLRFTEANSPLYFRSFLTLYTGGSDGTARKQMYLERSFYISQLIKTGNVPPQNFNAANAREGDFFYVHKVKGENTGIILGSIAIGVVGITLEAAVGSAVYR